MLGWWRGWGWVLEGGETGCGKEVADCRVVLVGVSGRRVLWSLGIFNVLVDATVRVRVRVN